MKMSSANAFNLDNATILSSGKGLHKPVGKSVNYLPNDKIQDRFKLKAFADDKSNMNKKLNSLLGRVENIMGKGDNANYQHFFLFPQCFEKVSKSQGR